jgi:hypothetical protein
MKPTQPGQPENWVRGTAVRCGTTFPYVVQFGL